MGDGIVKIGNPPYGLGYRIIEIFPYDIVFRLVGMKPLAVVVGSNISQILQDSLCIHLIIYLLQFTVDKQFRAETVERTLLAFGLPALADIAAMQQQPVVGIGTL